MTGNTGNTGNAGNTASAGNTSGSGDGWFFADRANRPWVNALDPPGTNPLPTIPYTPLGYADRNWDALWYGWRITCEFALAGLIDKNVGSITMPGPPAGDPNPEIVQLFALARQERADALNEIIAQKDEFISYFMGLLGSSPHARPYTYRLMYGASNIALFAVMHFKGIFLRQRPFELYPLLLPPFQAPGHAAYPSGHATQSQLISIMVSRLALVNMPAAARTILTNQLDAMAKRIARNREIGGLHYHSDSVDGQGLANAILAAIQPILAADQALAANARVLPVLGQTIAQAQTEWP
jgi:hypothetical protein